MTKQDWLDQFPWESEDQKKGFLALVQWVDKIPVELRTDDTRNAVVAAWFIQKDHESQVWWSEAVGNQVSALQDQIKLLQNEVLELKARLRNE